MRKAMVLAAGLGTRLRPLTDSRPKALVEVAGRTLLEITLTRLREFGVREVIVNAHHFAEMIIDFLRAHDGFGLRVEISLEELLLDTGGGLKQAAPFFLRDGDALREPFILHNVDVISTVDLTAMVRAHSEGRALATLAVQQRPSSRQLLFDHGGSLCGRRAATAQADELVRQCDSPLPLAFCGIHVISPRIIDTMPADRVFSIIDTYLQAAATGENIAAFRADQYYWRDLGRPESVAQAAADFASHLLP